MGIIKRQGIKTSIISYLAVLIGAISVLFIYPLNDEAYGLAQYIFSTAMLFVPFATLGIISLTVKFYPSFQTEDRKNHGFLTLLLLGLSLAILTFFIVFYFLKEQFYKLFYKLELNVDLIMSYQDEILITTIFLSFTLLLQAYAQNFKRIVIPQIINGFLFKITLPILVLATVYSGLKLEEYAWCIVYFFAFVLIAMTIYIAQQKQLVFSWDRSFLIKTRLKSMSVYSLFGALNLFGAFLAFRIDSIMIATMVSLSSNGVYNKILFIAAIIDIPLKAINQISAPIISDHSEKNKIHEIADLYHRSATTLFCLGVLIFLLIWFNLDDVFGIAVNPSAFENGKQIFLFLAIGKLVDLSMSINSLVIIYSKYFRYNIVFLLLLGVSNLILNYYLIGEFSVLGAAIATCISLVLYNLIKYIFIWKKLNIQPYTWDIVKILASGAAVFAVLSFIPDSTSHIANMIINSFVIISLYVLFIWRLKAAEDLVEQAKDLLSRIGMGQSKD